LPEPEAPVLPPEPVSTVVTLCSFISNQTTKRDLLNGTVYEDNRFILSANSESSGQPIDIEFNFYSGLDRIEIYQSETPSSIGTRIFTNEETSLNPVNLTTTRKRELNNLNLQTNLSFGANRWLRDANWSYSPGPSGTSSTYWIKNVGKMSFSYNYSAGRYITVRVVKGSQHYSYYMCYPVDSIETSNSVELLVYSANAPLAQKPVVKPNATIGNSSTQKRRSSKLITSGVIINTSSASKYWKTNWSSLVDKNNIGSGQQTGSFTWKIGDKTVSVAYNEIKSTYEETLNYALNKAGLTNKDIIRDLYNV
jgi:hypothetical protein